MPIKFLKFTRRKSVGNSLEAAYEPANQGNSQDEHESAKGFGGSGFRVLPQPNRGSGNTTSSSAYSAPDYGGSSNRLSSNSTLPSTDAPFAPNEYPPRDLYPYAGGQRDLNTGTRRSVGNTLDTPFSHSTMDIPQLETTLDTSSLFGDDMFDFGGSKDNDGGMGSITPTAPKIASNSIINTADIHYGIPPVPPPKTYDPSPTTSRIPASTGSAYANMFANSHHMDSDRPSNNESSPYHWDSNPPDDLLTSPIASNSARNSRNLTPGQKPTVTHMRTDSLEAPSNRPSPRPRVNNVRDSLGLKRVVRASNEDEDALIVSNSAQGSRPQPTQSKSSPPEILSVRRVSDKSKDRDSGWEETIPSASSSDHSMRSTGSSKGTTFTSPMMSRGNTDPYTDESTSTLQAKKPVGVQLTDEPESEEFDPSFSAAAALAAKYESSEPRQQVPVNRVMTRAQFERFQQQHDDQVRLSGKATDDDDSDVTDYEEETEAEKSRELARQRARQEAHLSVYRQQMMKISGTDPTDTPLLGINSRPGSMSTSALPLSHTSMDPGSSGKNSDEEDEEIPLAILMAHGFPSRNRPPTRLSNASSQPNLRGAAQNQDPRLPPFARHLPADPYNVGASIVNPMTRMPLAFGSGAGSVAGGSMYNGMPPSQLPGRGPQGLVGEIVRAEEQKAARRGGQTQFMQPQNDPFKQDPFDRPSSRGGGGMLGGGGGMQNNGMAGMGQGMMGDNMGMGMGGNGMGMGMGMGMGQGMGMGMGMGMPNSMGMPHDPMQAQMASMQQYMQMQMQYMQMQMQMQNASQQQLMPPMPMMGQQQRPSSMMTMNPHMSGLGVPQQSGRAMSMLDNQFPQMPASYAPSMQGQLGGPGGMGNTFLGPQGYTPSIAPSERSTIGQPSRYRPVSYQPGTSAGARTSTLTSSAGQGWDRKIPGPSHLKNTTTEDEEDEESGWEELNKRRQEKADGWRKRKETGGLKGMLNFGSTAASSNSSST